MIEAAEEAPVEPTVDALFAEVALTPTPTAFRIYNEIGMGWTYNSVFLLLRYFEC